VLGATFATDSLDTWAGDLGWVLPAGLLALGLALLATTLRPRRRDAATDQDPGPVRDGDADSRDAARRAADDGTAVATSCPDDPAPAADPGRDALGEGDPTAPSTPAR